MSKERQNGEIYRPMNEEFFNEIERQYRELAKVNAIEKIATDIPQKIVAYNGDPKGHYLYTEQRFEIAEALYNANYRKQSENVIELPCKVGDTVYYVDKGRMKEATVGEITVGRNNTWIIILEFVCEEDCDGCPFESWSQEYSGEWSCGGGWGTWNVDKDDFGKTVFLTKAEAEAKMKGGAE